MRGFIWYRSGHKSGGGYMCAPLGRRQLLEGSGSPGWLLERPWGPETDWQTDWERERESVYVWVITRVYHLHGQASHWVNCLRLVVGAIHSVGVAVCLCPCVRKGTWGSVPALEVACPDASNKGDWDPVAASAQIVWAQLLKGSTLCICICIFPLMDLHPYQPQRATRWGHSPTCAVWFFMSDEYLCLFWAVWLDISKYKYNVCEHVCLWGIHSHYRLNLRKRRCSSLTSGFSIH